MRYKGFYLEDTRFCLFNDLEKIILSQFRLQGTSFLTAKNNATVLFDLPPYLQVLETMSFRRTKAPR